jgi:hypothetical protein
MQGGDLGLGQALDAPDIEPLIGSVKAQRAQMVATLGVPEPDRSVLPATGEPAAIGTHFECPHHPLMGLLHTNAFSAAHLPPAQLAITASIDQQLPTGSPAQRRDYPHPLRQNILSNSRKSSSHSPRGAGFGLIRKPFFITYHFLKNIPLI